MTHLRNIALDLVEKRLWPVAVALVAALVAVPVLLGGDPPAAPALPPAADAGQGPAAAQIAVAAPDLPGGRTRLGALRDPFGREVTSGGGTSGTPSAASSTAARPVGGGATPAPGTGGAVPDDLGGGPLPSIGPLPGSPAPGGTTTTTVDAGPDVVTVRVGRAGKLATRRDVAVRTPLPSVDDPFLVYLGNKPDGRSAQFLVSADAVLTGDAACRPSPDLCEEIVMQAGMTEFFDVDAGDGEVVQYQMDVVRVGRAR